MVRIGVIGAGGNGRGHARYYARSERARLVGIADPDGERARQAAEETGGTAFGDFREFLDDVDAVVISSPNFLHRDHAVECARAGKHVYCEKPMGLDGGQADEIADAVREAGVRSTVGFSVRFTQPVQTMLRLIREGRIGDLISIWSRRVTSRHGADPSHWRADHRLSGGLLFEINIHELEWMMALGGTVRSVFGRTYAADASYERANDHIWFVLDFAGGAVASHEGSWICPAHDYLRGVFGTGGAAATAEWGNGLLFSVPGQKPAPVDLETRFDLRGHFLDCIVEGAEPVADVQWGRRVMAVADAILESAASGEVVQTGS